MDNGFDKIRLRNCTLYVNRNFRNDNLEQGLLAGEKQLQQRCQLTIVRSSKFSRVYRFTARFDNVDKRAYFKQYLCRSGWDFIKHLARASRARRAFKAALLLAENGFESPTIIAMGEHKAGFFHTGNFLVTLEVEGAQQIYRFIGGGLGNLTKQQLRGERILQKNRKMGTRDKRDLIRAFGGIVGRMHARGIFHGDLRLGNVLARQQNSGWRFFFIDNERTKKFHRLPNHLRLKNLVQANMRQTGEITNTDRMRFFREYWAENSKTRMQAISLIRKVLKKTDQRLSKRRHA